jgi:hypothetical protein
MLLQQLPNVAHYWSAGKSHMTREMPKNQPVFFLPNFANPVHGRRRTVAECKRVLLIDLNMVLNMVLNNVLCLETNRVFIVGGRPFVMHLTAASHAPDSAARTHWSAIGAVDRSDRG